MRLIKLKQHTAVTVTPQNVSDVSLTIRITYSQLGWILHILYDSSPFDFPPLTFSVLFPTDTLRVGLWQIQTMQIFLLTPHLHKEIADRTHSISELTTRMELPVVKVKLVSMHRPFSNWAGSLAISNHLPMNCEGRNTRAQRQFRTPSVESMNKSTYFSGFSNMYGRSPIKPVFHQLGKGD